MHDFRDHIFLARSSQFATRESAGCDLATRWVMENGAEECNAIVNMAELAHARSIRLVSACSDPRLVYKTHVILISGANWKIIPLLPRENSGCCWAGRALYKEEKWLFAIVSSRVFYRAHLAEWLRRSPAKIVLLLEFSRVHTFCNK